MAQGDWVTYEEFSLDVGSKVHNLASDAFKLGIVDSTVTPLAADATPRWADYSANEVATSGGYVAGGVALTGETFTEAAGVATFDDTANITISQNGSGFTDGYWGILYNDTAAADQAVGFVDLGGPVSEQAGDITITWNASGIFTITVSS